MGQGEVVQAHPWRHPRCAGRREHVPIVRDRLWVVPAFLGLDPGPLDGEAMVGEAQACQELEVLGKAFGEAIAFAGEGRLPSAFPLPPVRRRGRPLALRRRRPRPPHELSGPLHRLEYGPIRPNGWANRGLGDGHGEFGTHPVDDPGFMG